MHPMSARPPFADLPETVIPVPERLTGRRLLLRIYDLGDAPLVSAAVRASRARLAPWLPWAETSHERLEDSIDFCARSRAHWLLRRDDINYGLFAREGGAYLGGIGLHAIDWQVRRFEIGYWLRDGAEGRGYMTEAVRLLSGLLFESLGAIRVEIRCDARNERSRRVAERSGYVPEARLRHHERAPDGTLRDTLILAMIRPDFDAVRASWADASDLPERV